MDKVAFSKRLPGEEIAFVEEEVRKEDCKLYKYSYMNHKEKTLRFMLKEDFLSMFDVKIPVYFY